MIYNTKIITKTTERGVKKDVDYRVKNKVHCAGGVALCDVAGCELFGIVKDDKLLFCYKHYKNRTPQTKPLTKPKTLLKPRPPAGSPDY